MKERVEKLTKKIKKSFLFYVLGLIIAQGKKTCTGLSYCVSVSHDVLYRFLGKIDIFPKLIFEFMVMLANDNHKQRAGWLIIDDTVISKMFSKIIVGVHDLFNSATGRTDRGLCLVVIAWTNGIITIPLKFCWLFSREIAQKSYKSKSELAKEMLLEITNKVKHKYLLADAHYSTKTKLIPFLMKYGIKFLMKISKSKVIETKKGFKTQIKNCTNLKLIKNQHSSKYSAFLGGYFLNFAVQKIQKQNGDYILMYFVSNVPNLKSKDYIKIYQGRWHIEVMFRTLKQHLGLQQCESRDIDRQKVHVYTTFFAYCFLQYKKCENNFKNPEESIRYLSELKLVQAKHAIQAFIGNFKCFA